MCLSEGVRLNRTHVHVLGDCVDAFQSISRKSIERGLKQLPNADKELLLRYLLMYYPDETELSYFLETGERRVVVQRTGVSQGCPVGP